MTHYGKYKMPESDYIQLAKVRGMGFQRLEHWVTKGKFAGKWHYVTYPDPDPLDPSW